MPEKETAKNKVLRLQIPQKLFNRFYRSTDMSLQEQVILLIQDFVEAKEMDLESKSLENGNLD